ncbi:phage antirepressor KilAC domain-containing protein [Leuconostoc mesenteroides]|uniref:phage antirepressor KilAC domain-containing protein n=1 Tax=Leuconostoc mesenteroides TaxID=1245 RepID=UPI000E08F683|nr:phage antirepressor KilAC domain-containing protein [Leuconostoc mesenteroides]MBU6001182.1 phage antirepressor KilAC domain-containing protein [Lactococcus lactis]RDG16187.1 oxidoreductase [Leuconostoc mesenteroides subsp. mesenteroides]
MQEIIKINQNEQGETRVSARELYKELGVKKRFSAWFEQYQEMYVEGTDWTVVPGGTTVNNGGNGALRTVSDFSLTVDMAKNVAMMSKTEKSQQIRDYFIQVEDRYKKLANDPSYQMALGLKASQLLLEQKDQIIAEMKPKALFADAVATSHTSVLVGELAKILKQNGVDTGATRLFSWLRDNGYLIRRRGTDYNMPTQKSMELELFEIKETSIARSNGSVTVSKTPKVTGKGQQYFINKFLQAA